MGAYSLSTRLEAMRLWLFMRMLPSSNGVDRTVEFAVSGAPLVVLFELIAIDGVVSIPRL